MLSPSLSYRLAFSALVCATLFVLLFGVLFLYRRRRVPLADLESIRIETFVKGRLAGVPGEAKHFGSAGKASRARFVRMSAVDVRGAVLHLDSGNRAQERVLLRAGEQMAGFDPGEAGNIVPAHVHSLSASLVEVAAAPLPVG